MNRIVQNERGMALAVAIFALVIVGALVAGALFAGTQEQRVGHQQHWAGIDDNEIEPRLQIVK